MCGFAHTCCLLCTYISARSFQNPCILYRCPHCASPNYGKGRQGYGLLIQLCNYYTSKGLLQGLESICTVRSVLIFLMVPLNANIHAGIG